MNRIALLIAASALWAPITAYGADEKPSSDDYECFYSEDGSKVRCYKKDELPQEEKPKPKPAPVVKPKPKPKPTPPPPPAPTPVAPTPAPAPAPQPVAPRRASPPPPQPIAQPSEDAWEEPETAITRLSGFKIGYWQYTDSSSPTGKRQKEYSSWGFTPYETENFITPYIGIAAGVTLTGKQIKDCKGTATFITLNPYVHALFHSDTPERPHGYGGAGLGAYGSYADLKDAGERAFGYGLGFHLVGGGYLPITPDWGIQLELRYAMVTDLKMEIEDREEKVDDSNFLIQFGSVWRY